MGCDPNFVYMLTCCPFWSVIVSVGFNSVDSAGIIMNRSIFVMLAVVLLLICSVAEGADWRLYGADNGCNYYYDELSVKTLTKGIKRVLAKKHAENDKCILHVIKQRTELKLPIKGYENFSHTMALFKIDCSLEKTSTETFTNYDNKGNILESYTFSTESWSAIVPESIIYLLYKQICK